MREINLGRVTAYADAVNAGYTGTREEFAVDLANAATYAAEAGTSAAEAKASEEAAAASAETAEAAATEATGAEANVHADALAAQAAKTAAEGAEATAVSKAGEAANSASAAGISAAAASASETAAETYASTAGASATNAAGSASDAADSASAAASSASSAAASLGDVTAAQAAAINAIETKGEETLESIPADYTTLANDVTDLKSDLDAVDAFVNDELSFINYGYDIPFHQEENPSGSSWSKKIGYDRNKQILLLNKQSATDSYSITVRLSGTVAQAANNSGVAAWSEGITLKTGHLYLAKGKLLSGVCTSDGNTFIPAISVYETGSSTTEDYQSMSGRAEENTVYNRYFVPQAGKQYNVCLYIAKNTYIFTNAKILITLEDLTESALYQLDNLSTRVDALEEEGKVPDYYFENDYLDGKIKEINAIACDIGVKSLSTVFFTDYHREDNAKKSPVLIQYLLQETGLRSVIFGGDAFNHDYTSKVGGYKLLCDFLNDFKNVADSANLYLITGNHEMNNADLNHDSVELPKSVPYNLYNDPIYFKIKTLWQSGKNTNSFYVDDDVNKIRFYGIDCTSGASIQKAYLDVILPSLLTVPEDFSVVVFSHSGVSTYTSDAGDPPTYTITALTAGFDAIMQAGKAMNDGTNVTISATIGGNTYTWNLDFTGKARTFVGAIIGHSHFDSYYIYDNRFPVILTVCDTGAYRDTHPYRVAGTITEQAFDVVQIDIDSKRIYCTRIGYGQDRVFEFGDNAGLIA